MCVLLDMYEERGMEKINSLYHCLLEDNRMEDIQKAMLDAAYQKRVITRVWYWRKLVYNFHWQK